MHEASLAASILDIAFDIAKEHKADKINSIKILVGKLKAVDIDSLKFAFNALKDGTIADKCILYTKEVDIRIRCYSCKELSILKEISMVCPLCASFDIEVLEGDEFLIKEMEVD
ncbi:MAG: hydrogenase maturation nickel metallochaperone HypA [Deferribacterota bacterium]|nr:hydrogenase maturation nickel metallochaperone HypA [Deferribacterota bacterium]